MIKHNIGSPEVNDHLGRSPGNLPSAGSRWLVLGSQTYIGRRLFSASHPRTIRETNQTVMNASSQAIRMPMPSVPMMKITQDDSDDRWPAH